MEWFKIKVACSGVIPLNSLRKYFSEGIFGGNHVVMEEITDVLQFRLHSWSDFLFILMEIQHFDELFPIYQGFRFEFTVVE